MTRQQKSTARLAAARKAKLLQSPAYQAQQQLKTTYLVGIIACVMLIWAGFSVIQYVKVQTCINAHQIGATQWFNQNNCSETLK